MDLEAMLSFGGKLVLPPLPGDRLRRTDAMSTDILHGIVSGCCWHATLLVHVSCRPLPRPTACHCSGRQWQRPLSGRRRGPTSAHAQGTLPLALSDCRRSGARTRTTCSAC